MVAIVKGSFFQIATASNLKDLACYIVITSYSIHYTKLYEGSGYLKKGAFYYRHHFIMTHYAGPAIPIPDDHIRDNGGAFAGIGLQYSHSIFDSVSLGTGYVFNYDRLRNVYDSIHHGSLSHLYLELHGFGIRASQYLGNGQTFISGDGLYSAPSYQRIDLIWKIFRTKQVSVITSYNIHYTKLYDDPNQINEENFNTEAYLAGQYEGLVNENLPDLDPNKDSYNFV